MKRFVLVALALTLLFLGVVLFRALVDQPLYTQAISHRCKLTVRLAESSQNGAKLHVTFHYPPAIGMYSVADLEVKNPKGGFQFASVTDENTQLQCVYDANGSGFVFLYDHKTDDEWITGHPTGYADSPTLWSDRYALIRARFPTIPYDELPGRKQ